MGATAIWTEIGKSRESGPRVQRWTSRTTSPADSFEGLVGVPDMAIHSPRGVGRV